MRLIDADVLMKKIREVDFVADVDLMKITHDSMLTGFFHGSVQGIVDRLPTAYDPDKILEQLAMNSHRVETHEYGSERVVRLIDAIYIVKGIYEQISRGEFDKAIETVKGGQNG